MIPSDAMELKATVLNDQLFIKWIDADMKVRTIDLTVGANFQIQNKIVETKSEVFVCKGLSGSNEALVISGSRELQSGEWTIKTDVFSFTSNNEYSSEPFKKNNSATASIKPFDPLLLFDLTNHHNSRVLVSLTGLVILSGNKSSRVSYSDLLSSTDPVFSIAGISATLSGSDLMILTTDGRLIEIMVDFIKMAALLKNVSALPPVNARSFFLHEQKIFLATQDSQLNEKIVVCSKNVVGDYCQECIVDLPVYLRNSYKIVKFESLDKKTIRIELQHILEMDSRLQIAHMYLEKEGEKELYRIADQGLKSIASPITNPSIKTTNSFKYPTRPSRFLPFTIPNNSNSEENPNPWWLMLSEHMEKPAFQNRAFKVFYYNKGIFVK